MTAMLAALTFVCVGAISVWRLPLPWPEGEGFELPQLYQLGIAAAVLVGLGFTSVYAWRVAAEEERLNVSARGCPSSSRTRADVVGAWRSGGGSSA